jgi:hypothetical protein
LNVLTGFHHLEVPRAKPSGGFAESAVGAVITLRACWSWLIVGLLRFPPIPIGANEYSIISKFLERSVELRQVKPVILPDARYPPIELAGAASRIFNEIPA